jgi:ABC-type uncharacterized transport system substrate-binding protein
MRHLTAATALTALVALAPQPVAAHPHVFITVGVEVQYDSQGQMTGVRHRWAFDKMYSASAILGLDKNGDGKYERTELDELAKLNVESLKEFEYFTFMKIEGDPVTFADPVDYYVEADDQGLLTLSFTLPAKSPAKHGSLNVDLSVYDPSFFIAFSFAEKNPVSLAAAAPSGCRIAVKRPDQEQANNQLTEDMFSGAASVDYGAGFADTAEIVCR